MKALKCVLCLAVGFIVIVTTQGCPKELTSQEKQTVSELTKELSQIQAELTDASNQDSQYSGGLIKSLIKIRIEVLKTNEAIVRQRINSIETGAKPNIVVNVATPDPSRAIQLEQEIGQQRAKIAEARAYSSQYSGGLVKAMAESAVATGQQTLAMLEQQYLVAKYGLSVPALPAIIPEKEKIMDNLKQEFKEEPKQKCLEIGVYDASIQSSNSVFTEVAWKADINNNCNQAFDVRVRFAIYDDSEFELDSDSKNIIVPDNGTGKARGKMLVSPPEKARRMSKLGVSFRPN